MINLDLYQPEIRLASRILGKHPEHKPDNLKDIVSKALSFLSLFYKDTLNREMQNSPPNDIENFHHRYQPEIRLASRILDKHPEHKPDNLEDIVSKALSFLSLFYEDTLNREMQNSPPNDIKNFQNRIFKQSFKRSFKSILEIYQNTLELQTTLPHKKMIRKFNSPSLHKLFGENVYLLKKEKEVSYYAITQLIGEGSYNDVHLAIDILKGEYRAVRLAQGESTLLDLENLIKENKLQKALCTNVELSENTVQIFNTFYKSPYFGSILEMCNRGNLYDRLLQGMDNSLKAPIIISVFQYVSRMHANNYVLGDLKLENILLHESNDGILVVKFADFGGSFHIDTNDTIAYVSHSYMAPQFYMNFIKPYSKCPTRSSQLSDAWALGIFLYEMKYAQNVSDSRVPQFIKEALDANDYFSAETTQKDYRKSLEIISTGLKNIEKYINLNNPYDVIIADLLKFTPEDRLTAEQALKRLEKLNGC